MVREIQRAVPAYARPLRGKFGRVLGVPPDVLLLTAEAIFAYADARH